MIERSRGARIEAARRASRSRDDDRRRRGKNLGDHGGRSVRAASGRVNRPPGSLAPEAVARRCSGVSGSQVRFRFGPFGETPD
jgi:hypothetical protein